MYPCFRNDLGFVGVKFDPDTRYINGTKTYNWETFEGVEGIKKLQELKKHPVNCFLSVIMCNGDNTFGSFVKKINCAELSKDGYPQVSFDFDDNGMLMGAPTYHLYGWGVKETREVKVKEYHVNGDVLKNERTVKQLVIDGGPNKIDVVLEDGEVIPSESMRRIWAPQIEIPYDRNNPMAFMTRALTPPRYDSMRFVTYDGIKYIIK